MNTAFEYYRNGFLRSNFCGPAIGRLNTVLRDLFRVDDKHSMREGFHWEQKYPNTLDIRPNAHLYDSSIVDVLFDSNIPELLNEVVGSDMVLFHTQIRRSFMGPSYMDWHRDSYVYDGKPVGNFPPAHKIIFYPKTDHGPTISKMKLIPGSHLRHFDNHKDDMVLTTHANIESYDASETGFMLFNTSILHAAQADITPLGSIRVIYSFLRKTQFQKLYSHEPIHADQVRMYERLKGI